MNIHISYKMLILLTIYFVQPNFSQAQNQSDAVLKRLSIGDNVTDINFINTHNFPSEVQSIKDLEGKLILLDFWGVGCTSCIEAFPKMDSLQKKFGDKIQILVINTTTEDSKVEDYISKLKNESIKKAYYSLATSNGDKRWQSIFPHHYVPHHVWISPKGKILAITNSYNATSAHITQMLSGQEIEFTEKDDLIGYDVRYNGLLRQGHDKLPAPNYYSAFLESYSGIGGGTYLTEDSVTNTFRCTQRNQPVSRLYKLATREFSRVSIETKKIPGVKEYINTDEWRKNNLFSYELTLPLTEKSNYLTYFLEDLNRYFGIKFNIQGGREKKTYPAYILISENLKNGKSKRSDKTEDNNRVHIKSVMELTDYITSRFEDIEKGRIVEDETKLDHAQKLDIWLPSSISNIDTLKKFLQPFGFKIESENRTVELLVIKDRS